MTRLGKDLQQCGPWYNGGAQRYISDAKASFCAKGTNSCHDVLLLEACCLKTTVVIILIHGITHSYAKALVPQVLVGLDKRIFHRLQWRGEPDSILSCMAVRGPWASGRHQAPLAPASSRVARMCHRLYLSFELGGVGGGHRFRRMRMFYD